MNPKIRASIFNTSIRIEVTSRGAVIIPIDDYTIVNASKLGYGLTLQHITPCIIEQATLFARCAMILKIMMVITDVNDRI